MTLEAPLMKWKKKKMKIWQNELHSIHLLLLRMIRALECVKVTELKIPIPKILLYNLDSSVAVLKIPICVNVIQLETQAREKKIAAILGSL